MHEAVGKSTNNSNNEWPEAVKIYENYAAYRTKFSHMLSEFADMWDGHLRIVKATQNGTEKQL